LTRASSHRSLTVAARFGSEKLQGVSRGQRNGSYVQYAKGFNVIFSARRSGETSLG